MGQPRSAQRWAVWVLVGTVRGVVGLESWEWVVGTSLPPHGCKDRTDKINCHSGAVSVLTWFLGVARIARMNFKKFFSGGGRWAVTKGGILHMLYIFFEIYRVIRAISHKVIQTLALWRTARLEIPRVIRVVRAKQHFRKKGGTP